MRLLDRYLGRELLSTGAFAVATLSFVLVLGQIFKKLFEYVVDHNTPASFIFTFIAYFLPASLTLTIPWAFLTAVLLVFGKLSAGNELTALRSAGVSIGRIAQPVILFALALCGVCLWINLSVAPRAQQKLKDTFFQMATTNPTSAFNSEQVITVFPGRKIYVGRKEGNELQNLHVFELNAESQPVRVVYAERGRLESDVANKQIKMRLEGTRYEQRDDKNPDDLHRVRDGITAGVLPFPVSLEELYAKKQGKRRIESLSISELISELRTLKAKFKGDKKTRRDEPGASSAPAAAATPPVASAVTPPPPAPDAVATAAPSADATPTPAAARTGKRTKGAPSASAIQRAEKIRFTSLRTELNKRFSYSLACLVFALIGIPLGITAHRQETSIGFGISLGVAFVYYLIIIFVNTFRDKASAHPEWLIWLPNALFLAVGIVLMFRLSRR